MQKKILGKVIDSETGKGISNVKIETVAKDLMPGENFGIATTDKCGGFEIRIDENTLDEEFLDVSPDIYLNVYNSHGEVIYTTQESIKSSLAEIEPLTIKIPYYLVDCASVVTARVNRKEGGCLAHPHGLTLVIQPGSLAADACIEIAHTEYSEDTDEELSILGAIFNIYSSEKINVKMRLPVLFRKNKMVQSKQESRTFFFKIRQDKVTKVIASPLKKKTEDGETFFMMEASVQLPRRTSVTVMGGMYEANTLPHRVFHPVPHYFKSYELGMDEDGNCRREGGCGGSSRIYPACIPAAKARLYGAYQLLLPPEQRRWYVGTPANHDPDPEEHGDHFTTVSASMADTSKKHAVYLQDWRTNQFIEFEKEKFEIGEFQFSLDADEYKTIMNNGVVEETLIGKFNDNNLELENGIPIIIEKTNIIWYINDDVRSQCFMMELHSSTISVYLCNTFPIEDAIDERARLLTEHIKDVVGGGKPVYVGHSGHGWTIVGVDRAGYWSHGQSPTEALSAWTTWENAPWINQSYWRRLSLFYKVIYPKECDLKPVEKRLGSISIAGSGGAINMIQFVDLPNGRTIDWTPNKAASSANIGYVWIEDGSPLNADGIPTTTMALVPEWNWDSELGYRIPVPENNFGQCSCYSIKDKSSKCRTRLNLDGCSKCRTRLHLPFWVHNTTLDQALTYKVDLYFWSSSGRWVRFEANSMDESFHSIYMPSVDKDHLHNDKYNLPGPLPSESFEITAVPNTTPGRTIERADHPLNWQPILWRIDFHKSHLKEWNIHGIKLVLTCVDNYLVQDVVQIWFKTQNKLSASSKPPR